MEITAPKKITELRIKLFADDGKSEDTAAFAKNPLIKGFTTNPSLMLEAGVTAYEPYARELLARAGGKPVSFEVFAEDAVEMERQARVIHSWESTGDNLYVKIPILNTKGESSAPLIAKLSAEGMKINATLIITPAQIREAISAVAVDTPSIISIFAGRIADVGIDPLPLMCEAKALLSEKPQAELLWASCREVINIYEAESVGADIITVPPGVLKKLSTVGTSLEEVALEGAQAFSSAGQKLKLTF
jgi:transaldolase